MVVIPVTFIAAASNRSKVEARLRAAGAITPGQAVDLLPEGDEEVRGLDEAIGLGRVVRGPNGRLYLNPAATGSGGEAVFGVLLFLLVTASMLVSVIALITALKK